MSEPTPITIELPADVAAQFRALAELVRLTPEACLAALVARTVARAATMHHSENALEWNANRTAKELAADREEIFANSRPPRPLPPGKTLADVVEGTWPGDETDEEVQAFLDRIS
jgi:hypothetical protein